jgi:capsular exopolysaccharide synthesis family protein
LAGTQRAIRDESARIAARAKNDYEASVRVEGQERADFEGEKRQAETLNSKAVEYEIARQEAAQSRSLYESLRGRLKEADVVAGLRSSNIALVDAAHVPAKPAKPNVLMYAAGGIAVGVLLGIITALLRDASDHRIHDIGEARALMGGALIGFVPHHSGLVNRSRALRLLTRSTATTTGSAGGLAHDRSAALIAQLEPHSAFSESLRSLRTAIEQTTLCQRPPRVILVTSSVPGEGKTSLSLNLAAIHAQGGRKVLLVDTDLRTPTLGRRLSVNESSGLSSFLLGEDCPDRPTPIRIALDGRAVLDVIPAGPVPAYPTELLASEEMARLLEEWRCEYDYVLLDSAPLLPVTDSALLSKLVDYTVVVARHKMTDLRSMERTSELLQSRGIFRAGVVLNGIQAGSGDLYRHYGYKQPAYYGGRINA